MKPIDSKTVRFGSDAEVFLQTKNGMPFPACGLIGGTKEKPLVLDRDGCAVQEDNVMLEFNTPISASVGDWVRNLDKAMRLAFAKIPPTLEPVFRASMHFDLALLDNPQAQVFGCEPDFNAWTGQQNPRPIPTDPTLRTAAAHVHISWDKPEDMEQRMRLIQMADVFVVLPSLGESEDKERRQLYGKAGAFRPKEYGVEHRVLDNYWLTSQLRQERIFLRYHKAIDAANSEYQLSTDQATKVQELINTSNGGEWPELYDDIHEAIFKTRPYQFLYDRNVDVSKPLKSKTKHIMGTAR